jgi:hypothetical protein
LAFVSPLPIVFLLEESLLSLFLKKFLGGEKSAWQNLQKTHGPCASLGDGAYQSRPPKRTAPTNQRPFQAPSTVTQTDEHGRKLITMSPTVPIGSSAEFSKIVSTSTIVVTDCKLHPSEQALAPC